MKYILIVVSALTLISCVPPSSSGNGSSMTGAKLQISFRNAGQSRSLVDSNSGPRAITGGVLGSQDTYAFVESSWTQALGFLVGKSTNTLPGMGRPFYIFNTALGPNVSDGTPANGSSNLNKYFQVTMGGSTTTDITVTPMSAISGSYDEAILNLKSGYAQDGFGNYYDYGPHFNIYANGATIPTIYGGSGYPGEKSLQFNGVALGNSQAYTLFVPAATSGVSASTGFSTPITIAGGSDATNIATVKANFLDAVARSISSIPTKTASDLTATQQTYFSGFFTRYCLGNNNGVIQMGGNIGGPMIFEIVPLPNSFDFGDGSKVVTVTITFDQSKATYDDTTTPNTLNVTGTPPLNYSVAISN